MSFDRPDSEFLEHAPCPNCDSSDAFALYDDGHGYCFSCDYHEPPDENDDTNPSGSYRAKGGSMADDLIEVKNGEYRRLRSRNIDPETCETFGYETGVVKGNPAQVAPYYNEEGHLVAQKVRWPEKRFAVYGDLSEAMPFGYQAWPETGKYIAVTEGEIDALAVSQVQGNKYPVVSVPNGAAGAAKFVSKCRDYFLGFDTVVLMFDEDEDGQKAAEEVAEVLLPHTVKIARLPLKDPGAMLEAGRTEELITAFWKAKEFQPEGIVNMGDLVDKALEPPEWGLSWPFETLTEATYGMRRGELYALGAGTGIGKTDFICQTVMHLVREHDEACGVFALESQPQETSLRVAGKMVGVPLHVPDQERDEETVREAYEKTRDKVYIYDSFGSNDWEPIRSTIEYLYHNHGVEFFFLDHITALAAKMEDERKMLDQLMEQLGSLVNRLDICVTFVSHLATPRGTPHEEGGRVMIRHFRGSRAIGFWSHFIFGLERDQQSDNPAERKTTTFRILKDRYTGRSTGTTFHFTYDEDTGLLHECSAPDSAEEAGFQDETQEGDDEDDFAF